MFYDPDRHTDSYRRHLPHWQQGSAISFVTFRLADSIPAKVLADWDTQRRIWLLHRTSSAEGNLEEILVSLPESDRRDYLRRFGKQFHNLLDSGHGSCLLRDPRISEQVEFALQHFDGERYLLGDYVVMPNHVHALIAPMPGHETSTIIGSWKKFSARQINALSGREGTLWQGETFDHLVRNAGSLEGFQRYIRENPPKANLRPAEFRLGCGKM